jgi:hypothetical protein
VILPIILIFFALSAAAAVAFGTDASWAQMDQGLSIILWSRRMQWLLVGISVAGSLGLISLAIADRKRAWWMLGLAPVLLLFVHRFGSESGGNMAVVEDPTFVEIDKADFIKDEDWVVTLRVNDKAFAYPYAALYVEPAVVQAEHDKRVAIFWNARANRVTAFVASADFRARDLEVVSTPADSLLLYNSRFGQFICGVTGLTPERAKPTGLDTAIATGKTTYAKWKSANPAGLVMKPNPKALVADHLAPTQPITPLYAEKKPDKSAPAQLAATPAQPAAARRKVAIVGSTHLLGVDAATLTSKPSLVKVGDQQVVLLRGDMSSMGFRALIPKLDDLTLHFEPKRDPKLADVRMTDRETGSLWTAAGQAVGSASPLRGKRLASLPVDEDVDYEVMKHWMPELEVYAEPAPTPPVTLKKPASVSNPTTRPARRSTTKKTTTAKPAAIAPKRKM